ncbi:MAG: 16S rRNA (guanine(527)-N(7))-methyltransferase RsmG [Bacilli bacterium]
MNENQFKEELQKINIYPTPNQIMQIEEFYKLLVEWNKKINLTAITEKEDVYLKHFYDSLTIVKACDLSKEKNLCDIGTGAGFPGIVIKIIFPELKICLVDSLNKRIKFLNIVIEKLQLTNIETVHSRAEEFSKINRKTFDVVTARAVTSLPVLLEYCIPLLKVGKYFIALKGNAEEEIKNSKNALKILNSTISKKIEFNLPVENSRRTILVIKKLGNISDKYPRSINEIIKKSL